MMKIGAVKSMARFAILNIPFIIALLLPAYKGDFPNSKIFLLNDWFVYPVILLTSLMNGFGQGVVQPASGNYISDCANEENKGFYFALFWSFYMGSQVFGNLLAAFLLGNFPQKYFVMMITAICSAATALLFTLKNPVVHHSDHPDEHAVGEGDEAKNVTVKGGVLKLWNLCKDRRFLYLIPQSSWTGISIAYFSGNLIEMLEFHAPFNPGDVKKD
jgi:MFS family permease